MYGKVNVGSGGENVTTEVNEYTDLLAQAVSAVQSKLWEDKKGRYLWKKYSIAKELPIGYTQLEYIKSSGTQAIKTGFIPGTEDFTIEMDIAPIGTSSPNWFMSINPNEPTGTATYIQVGTSGAVYALKVPGVGIDGVERYEENIRTIVLDVKSTVAMLTCDETYTLTRDVILTGTYRNNELVIGEGNWKMAGVRVYASGVLVRNYKPCISPTGVIGMYDLVNNAFVINSGTGDYVGSGEAMTFDEYAVSDSEATFPDKAVHTDGYWYEKALTGIAPEMFGCTKFAVDTVSFTENVNVNTAFPHSLGEKPKMAFLSLIGEDTAQPYHTISQAIHTVNGNYDYAVGVYYPSGNKAHFATTVPVMTAETVTLLASSNGNQFFAGEEFMLVTMA